jgi:hypothetical protein
MRKRKRKRVNKAQFLTRKLKEYWEIYDLMTQNTLQTLNICKQYLNVLRLPMNFDWRSSNLDKDRARGYKKNVKRPNKKSSRKKKCKDCAIWENYNTLNCPKTKQKNFGSSKGNKQHNKSELQHWSWGWSRKRAIKQRKKPSKKNRKNSNNDLHWYLFLDSNQNQFKWWQILILDGSSHRHWVITNFGSPSKKHMASRIQTPCSCPPWNWLEKPDN